MWIIQSNRDSVSAAVEFLKCNSAPQTKFCSSQLNQGGGRSLSCGYRKTPENKSTTGWTLLEVRKVRKYGAFGDN